jgi:hypothetical protein
MSLRSQEEILEKSIETGDFLSEQGLLKREQQREFIVLLKRFSSMFNSVRTMVLPQASMDINKLHIGEPVTISLGENSNPVQDNKLLANQVHIDAKKVRSSHDITTEVLQQNIEGDEFEVTAMRAFAARMALDLELLALLGDESLTPQANDKLGQLLSGNDGWFVQAQEGHVLDLGGATIETGIFSEMLRMLPKQYRGDPGLRFIVGETSVIDWQDTLQARPTGLGDAALADMGPSRAPFGKQFMVAPLIPDDLPLAVTESVPAVVQGVAFGPYQVVPGLNDQLTINVNGAGAFIITLVPLGPGGTALTGGGVLETRQIVKQINDAFVATTTPAIAFDNGDGLVTIKTLGTGAGVSIAITAAGARDISGTLGLTDGAISVAVAGAAGSGTVLEGSFIMLTNPRNLIWAILDGTRIFSEFNKDFDRTEVVAFNQVDTAIENPDALVLATNLRRKNHVSTSIP